MSTRSPPVPNADLMCTGIQPVEGQPREKGCFGCMRGICLRGLV